MLKYLFREHAPSIIFMDEIDSIGSSRLEGGSGGRFNVISLPGFQQALEIMENLENSEKKFHAWKNHGI